MIAKVVLLPGDGIGPEVIDSAAEVLQRAAFLGHMGLEIVEGWIGGAAYERCGSPLDPETLDACRAADGVLLGAVGGPRWDDLPGYLRPEAGLLSLRKELQVFANIRPVLARPTLVHHCPYRPEVVENVDILIVRELTGGIYFGEKGKDERGAFDVCRYNSDEIERIIRIAADLARSRKKKLVSIDKANVLETSRLWRKTTNEVIKRDYPDLQLQHILVDAAAMYLAQRPSSFDVIVTDNMFGDILSDQASTIAGSLGLLPSASLGYDGRGVYEPVHGSAPDIAGKQIANPLGAILSAALMLRHSLKRPDLAQCVEKAVEQVLAEGWLTADLGSENPRTTDEITKRVCLHLR